MRVPVLLTLAGVVVSFSSFAQKPADSTDNPVFFVDSVRAGNGIENEFSPDNLAAMTIVKGEPAIRIAGEAGKDGVVYVFTKPFAKRSYQRFFRAVSESYASAVTTPDDSDVIYILDNEVLTDNVEGILFSIEPKDLADIKVIDKKELKKRFKKEGRIGVMVTTRKGS